MIRSKKELAFYIMADNMMNFGYFRLSFIDYIKQLLRGNDIAKFLKVMRKCQYYNQLGGGKIILL